MNLNVSIGSIVFDNPVTVASGTFSAAEKFYGLKGWKRLGAIVPKTITLHAREGNPPPRIWETPAGMINAIGLENAGTKAFITDKLPGLASIGRPLIISVLGYSVEEFQSIVELLAGSPEIVAIELNLSCPNLKQKKLVAQDPQAAQQIVAAVKRISSKPMIAKLSPNVTDITEIAQAVEAAGADAISLVNTFSAMAIDIHKQKPVLGNITGGLSGPAIRPIAVCMVYQTYKKVNIPIIGMGGIMTAGDAIEFILAGATMVAVGTANFIQPQVPLDVLNGIRQYMKDRKIADVKDLIGAAHRA
ncbi:MAG: dihydroorotate dehydrogenase [Candidatus Omnitrophica bacterium]|nr:dihydroorotate dehydrogenase [Candidatus Omnitrophota bacterium]